MENKQVKRSFKLNQRHFSDCLKLEKSISSHIYKEDDML